MLKKIIIGLLLITVIGGAVFALTDNQNNATVVTATATATPTAIAQQPSNGNGNGNAGQGNGNADNAQSGQALAEGTQPVQNSVNNVGDAWSGKGTLVEVTTVGMTLALSDGSQVYVELGPQDYWQAQGLTLNAGDSVSVEGFFNGTDYHARTVSANGTTIAVRDENGQPLWSGGNNASAGANGGQGEVQIPADQWVTVEGSITALTNNGLVIRTTDAQTLTVSFGRADFWQSQSVSFATGDDISMLGFWQGDQFSVGQVTKTSTGERILLRDPNGRPLWAGPGRGQGNGTNGTSGQSSSTTNQTNASGSGKLANASSNQGKGNQANANSQGKGNSNAGNGNGNASQGNGNGGQGNGNQGNGNQGNGNGGNSNSNGKGNGNGSRGNGNSNGNRGNGNGQQQYNQLQATPTPASAY